MFKIGRQRSADPGLPGSNPFDLPPKEHKLSSRPARASSEPVINPPDSRATLLGYDDETNSVSSSASSSSYMTGNRKHYKNDFRGVGGLQTQTTEELESYAVYKAEEVTRDAKNCLKIAEDIREDATKTMISLHHQGEQITRVHMSAADIDHDLSVGEKLLGSLGGIFSKTWKPKKNRPIKGPVISRDDSFKRRGSHLEKKERLGLMSNPKKQSNAQQKYSAEPSTALEKVEVEKATQDDALSDLSNVLGQLKDMAVDMGSEIERQNKALDHLDDDVVELDFRVKGATRRGRHLLGK